MKTIFYKAFATAALVLLCSGHIHAAGVAEKFYDFIGSEFTNLRGFYIMAGIVAGSLAIYFVANHFSKKEEERVYPQHYSQNRRNHHHHRVIKKTS
jgi:hypothetical protein